MKGIFIAALVATEFTTAASAATIDQNWESRFVRAPGLNGSVFSMVTVGTNLFVGGAFTTAGVSNTAGVARWNGNSWASVGGGINGDVFALATDGTNLYAGGSFHSAGGVAATNIAKWDGTNWASIGALSLPGSLNPALANVHALIWDQDLLAGGMFTQAGSVAATNVARWDGQTWHAIGDGLGVFGPGNDVFQVFALTGHNNDLYAGGLFHRSGEIGVTNLARWTGTNWMQVGGGVSGGSFGVFWQDETGGYILSGAVYALNSSAAGLIVGGDFTSVGGSVATNIALWNGTNWNAIGGFTDGAVYHIATDGTNQLTGGVYSTIGGIPASGIAKWNGTTWEYSGQGVIGAALVSARAGTNLYLGGNFQVAGGQAAGHIARWNGTDWAALTAGDSTAPSGTVNSLALGSDGQLYAAGDFISAGKVRLNRVGRYDGTSWHALGQGFTEPNIHSISVVGTNVYVKGYFNRPASGVTDLARWNGSDWVALGLGLGNDGYSPMITSLAAGTSNLFVSGYFKTAGGVPATNLARWDGSQWHSLDNVSTADNSFIATRGDDLFVCEYNHSNLRVRRWQSGAWTQVGADILLANASYIPPSMVWAGTNLYVAGNFIVTNDFFATNLLGWNGTIWAGVSHPFGADKLISPVTTDGTNLFVAINSDNAAVTEVTLAKWNGNQWMILGTGTTSERPWVKVSSLAVCGRDLFVGGDFTSAGGKPADNLAIWHDFPEVTLMEQGWQPNGEFGLRVLGAKNQSVQIQTSTNLQNWLNLGTLLPTSDACDFTDATPSPAAMKFYRLLLLP